MVNALHQAGFVCLHGFVKIFRVERSVAPQCN